MKLVPPALILLALLALVPGTLLAAGTPATASTVAATSPAAASSLDDFFASLAGGPSNRSEISAIGASTICQSNADCPRGWLCCYPCGIPDCNFVCMKVKRCPLFP